MNTTISASAPDARERLLAQWHALRAENTRDRSRIFDESTATTAINAALRVAETLGDRDAEGYIAYGVPGSYQGTAWSDAVAFSPENGEITLRIVRRDSVRNAGRRAGLCLALKVRGKGAREVNVLARAAFVGVVA